MLENVFLPNYEGKELSDQTFSWSVPSNIALVKYWGKRAVQIPENASVSFTLSNCKTITSLHYNSNKLTDSKFSFDIFVDDVWNKSFRAKIESFFEKAVPFLPFLTDGHFEIRTTNTFPHSSGIASSASGMAALALCLMSCEKTCCPDLSEELFFKKASFLARLGSGSACRSIEGPLVAWGKHKDIPGSSDLFGTTLKASVCETFTNYQDTILIVEEGQKQVSSTLGHNLMHGHPFAQKRFEQAEHNVSDLLKVMIQGDMDQFIRIVESEALSLHAMMMTSNPAYVLMQPHTLSIIKAIWDFRKTTEVPLCFTLDAGANVHLLYPYEFKNEVLKFIEAELVVYCQNGRYICDATGVGAQQLKV